MARLDNLQNLKLLGEVEKEVNLVDLNKPQLVVVDMINGFCKEGILADKEIMNIVPAINNCSAYLDYCDNFIVLDNPISNISSTEVRKCLKNKDFQRAKRYIYPSVYNYILENNLYIK